MCLVSDVPGVICSCQIFGPVQQILKFKTMAEVIERANDTEYGLAAVPMVHVLYLVHNPSRSPTYSSTLHHPFRCSNTENQREVKMSAGQSLMYANDFVVLPLKKEEPWCFFPLSLIPQVEDQTTA